MNEFIEHKLDEIEDEWERPIGERLLKVVVIGVATVLFGWGAESLYDKIRDRDSDDGDDIIETQATE